MQIVNFRKGDPSGKEVAVFDIFFSTWEMTFHNWKILNGKKGLFIATPSYCETSGAEKKFKPYISFSKDKQIDFEKKIWSILKEYM